MLSLPNEVEPTREAILAKRCEPIFGSDVDSVFFRAFKAFAMRSHDTEVGQVFDAVYDSARFPSSPARAP